MLFHNNDVKVGSSWSQYNALFQYDAMQMLAPCHIVNRYIIPCTVDLIHNMHKNIIKFDCSLVVMEALVLEALDNNQVIIMYTACIRILSLENCSYIHYNYGNCPSLFK